MPQHNFILQTNSTGNFHFVSQSFVTSGQRFIAAQSGRHPQTECTQNCVKWGKGKRSRRLRMGKVSCNSENKKSGGESNVTRRYSRSQQNCFKYEIILKRTQTVTLISGTQFIHSNSFCVTLLWNSLIPHYLGRYKSWYYVYLCHSKHRPDYHQQIYHKLRKYRTSNHQDYTTDPFEHRNAHFFSPFSTSILLNI
jgi:hypothetical protein